MPRDDYDDMLIFQARQRRARAAWIDRCATVLGLLKVPGLPDALEKLAAGLHDAAPSKTPEDAARDFAASWHNPGKAG